MAILKKLFVVDDDLIFQSIFKYKFTNQDAIEKISFFNNGQEAFDHLNEIAYHDFPEIILLDINMPIMNGHEFLEAVSEMSAFNPKTKIILFSSSELRSDTNNIEHEYVVDYFVKPVTDEHIQKLLVYAES